jgi:hypothetical protein
MALSVDTSRTYELGDINDLPVKASATIYEGSAIGLSSGYARALTAGDVFQGFAERGVVESTGVAGAVRVRVIRKGKIKLTITSVAVTDVGKTVYAADDGTFYIVNSGSYSPIGKVERYVTTDTAIVEFDAGAQNKGKVGIDYITYALAFDGAGALAGSITTTISASVILGYYITAQSYGSHGVASGVIPGIALVVSGASLIATLPANLGTSETLTATVVMLRP